MADSLTESVARLHRAGSEHSQEARKLRVAADSLIMWIADHAQEVDLPMSCVLYGNNNLYRTDPLGHEKLNMTIGQQHTRLQLVLFAKLIDDGFIDQLSEKLEEEAKKFRTTSARVESLIRAP